MQRLQDYVPLHNEFSNSEIEWGIQYGMAGNQDVVSWRRWWCVVVMRMTKMMMMDDDDDGDGNREPASGGGDGDALVFDEQNTSRHGDGGWWDHTLNHTNPLSHPRPCFPPASEHQLRQGQQRQRPGRPRPRPQASSSRGPCHRLKLGLRRAQRATLGAWGWWWGVMMMMMMMIMLLLLTPTAKRRRRVGGRGDLLTPDLLPNRGPSRSWRSSARGATSTTARTSWSRTSGWVGPDASAPYDSSPAITRAG
jgi:hypothetical protein